MILITDIIKTELAFSFWKRNSGPTTSLNRKFAISGPKFQQWFSHIIWEKLKIFASFKIYFKKTKITTLTLGYSYTFTTLLRKEGPELIFCIDYILFLAVAYTFQICCDWSTSCLSSWVICFIGRRCGDSICGWNAICVNGVCQCKVDYHNYVGDPYKECSEYILVLSYAHNVVDSYFFSRANAAIL